MLLFYALNTNASLDSVRQQGVTANATTALSLHSSLNDAAQAATGPVLVVDPTALNVDLPPRSQDTVQVSSIPAAAIQNLSPYLPPQPVVAAGGYVACPLPHDIALLLIYRRGVWDLPKGHLAPGEDLETCAVREVCEEVGITDLRLVQELDTTQHGYPNGDHYAVKTTHWYLMRTPERSFRPERREGIRRVAPARWPVARRHIGYDTLRRHMDRVEVDVRAALS